MMVANMGPDNIIEGRSWMAFKVPGRVMLMLGAIQARLGGENKW